MTVADRITHGRVFEFRPTIAQNIRIQERYHGKTAEAKSRLNPNTKIDE